MRKSLTAAASIFLFILFTIHTKGQQTIQKETIHFPSGKYAIPTNYLKTLDAFVEKFSSRTDIIIQLEGNTDNVGRNQSNMALSESRASAVKDYLVKSGLPAHLISTSGLGPDNPVATNGTSAGRKLNRRVDILILQAVSAGPAVEDNPPIQDISELYKLLQTPLQEFCVNPRRDTAVRCKQGTVIYIKANSLLQGTNCGNSCVTLRIREDLLKSDMMLDNLSTTSNGEIIETQGMIYTEAVDCNGNKLQLQGGKDLVIVLPIDSVNSGAKIFKGRRREDSVMNWTVDSSSTLSSFSLEDLNMCGRMLCGRPDTVTCSPCAFFFCRVGRIGNALGGAFNKSQRQRNIRFQQCQEKLKRIDDSSVRVVSTNPTVTKSNGGVEERNLSRCRVLEALLAKYGVSDMKGLVEAINQPLLDSFKTRSIDELVDTLEKINRQRVEVAYRNKQISISDLQFYIYNTPALGWTNIDVFADFPASLKTTMRVNFKPLANTDCKLVFKNRNILLPGTRAGEFYEFRNVPKFEPAILFAIKYENGRPFLSMKEITISNTTLGVEFKELTLEELKQELKKLD